MWKVHGKQNAYNGNQLSGQDPLDGRILRRVILRHTSHQERYSEFLCTDCAGLAADPPMATVIAGHRPVWPDQTPTNTVAWILSAGAFLLHVINKYILMQKMNPIFSW